MNSSIAFTAGLSDQLQGGFNNLVNHERGRLVPVDPVLASTARGRAVPAPLGAYKPFDECVTDAEVSSPMAEEQTKGTRAGSEALGFGLVVTLVLGVGTAWAWVVVQLAVMVSQMEPLLVRNILWTHQ